MAQCEYSDFIWVRCKETAQTGKSLCILHDKAPAKNAAEFLKTLKGKVEKEERDDVTTEVNLDGVVFPPGFRWADVVSSAEALNKSVSFRDAMFSGDAFFGGAHFGNAKSPRDADFWGATFKGDAHFGGAVFSGDARFGGAVFSGHAYFWRGVFNGDAIFWGARFSGGASFWYATFKDRLRFQETAFQRSESQGVVKFENVTLEKPERVYFQNVNLSRVSFLGTDIRNVHFLNTTWAKLPKRKRIQSLRRPLRFRYRAVARLPRWLRHWPRKRPLNVLYDDPRVSGGGRPQEPAFHRAAELYRQLRVNLEENRQHIEAGDFYVGQMDMRLHDSRLSRLHRGLLWLYGRAVLYGESFLRPLALYGITALVFGLGYLWAGFHSVHRPVLDLAALADWAFWKDYGEAVVLALRAGPIPVSEPEAVSRWMLPLRYLNALANVLLLAVAVIALRRAFRR